MTTATCYDHRSMDVPPAYCGICGRIGVERAIVTKAVDTLIAAGYKVWEDTDGKPADSKEATLALLFDLDDAHLMCLKPPAEPLQTDRGDDDDPVLYGRPQWVRFIFGNDGWDVISDYHVGLEKDLKPVLDYVDSIAPR